MVAKSLTMLLAVTVAALFVRLAGGGAAWLPTAGLLLVAACAVLALRTAMERRVALASAARDPRPLLERHGFAIGVIVTALLAVAMRLPSLGVDLGHQPLDIDENSVAANDKEFFISGRIGHDTVEHYPGIYYWLLVGASLFAYLGGLMSGAFATVQAMPVESFVLAGRLTNVLLAAATVVVIGLIGRQVAGGLAGVVAAGIFAVVPLSVETTTVLRNDAAQVLFVGAAVHAALSASASDRRRWPLLAGAFAGLATAIKYTSVFALAPALIAALGRGTPATRAARAALAGLAFLVTVGVSNHFLWYDFPNFVRQLSDQVAITGPGHWAAGVDPAAIHREVLVGSGVGWVLLVLAAMFGVHGLATGRRQAWVFWAFPVLYSWFTTKRPSQFARWVFPLLPFVVVAGAAALTRITAAVNASERWTRRAAGGTLRAASLAALVFAALGQPAWSALVTATGRLAAPTHRLVEQWLRERPAGSRVLLPAKWLKLGGAGLEVRRVPDLAATLGGGVLVLAANDFIVVPEPFFGNPGLQGLRLEKRIRSEPRSPGGRLGYDFEVYAAPRLPLSSERVDIQPGDEQASAFLGEDWSGTAHGTAGVLPSTGGSLFVPPRSAPTVTLTVDLADADGSRAALPIKAFDSAGAIALADAGSLDGPGRCLTGTARLSPSGRATEIRLFPAPLGSRVRVLRVRIG